MLKYNINHIKLRNDIVPIDIENFSIETLYNDDYPNSVMVVCDMPKPLDIDVSTHLIMEFVKYVNNDDELTFDTVKSIFDIQPFSVSDDKKSFQLLADKYLDLSINNVYIDESKEWVYIVFNQNHLFDVSSNRIYDLYIEYRNFDNGNIIDKVFHIGNHLGNSGTLFLNNSFSEVNAQGEYVTKNTIRLPYSVLTEENNELYNAFFYDDNDERIGNWGQTRLYRDSLLCSGEEFAISYEKAMCSVQIPLFQKFSTDLLQDNAIEDDFTNIEIKRSINKMVEMEKDIYYPVIFNSTTDKIIDDVYNIRFNLHFRKHNGDGWIVDNESLWNGMDDDCVVNKGYTNRQEQQSDLISYLGFTDKDVRYQKSKLKKSFLRVMFYDSPNVSNQNLLAYYTVFMDSGSYFAKYARYIEKSGYVTSSNTNLNGIKVNREPTQTSDNENIDNNTSVEDIENVRLSSQMSISDKYSSDKSSEGFYLYLWKDNMNGTVPTDIYMKVEFNHAGYGRTIPFMCPFTDTSSMHPFKTFKNIQSDWSDENEGYGIKKYLRYSYIHFKYKYDKDTNRHIYYLDDDFYGPTVRFKDNSITLNLYEAKIV